MNYEQILELAIYSLPLLVVCIAGIIYLANKKRISRRPCILGMTILGVLMAVDLVSFSIYLFVFTDQANAGNFSWILRVMGIVQTIFHNLGLLGLIFAIGLDRKKLLVNRVL